MDDGQPSISASQPKKYDVFISFRGEDTRRTIVSFLYEKFKDNGIDAYIDDRLERGEEISTALLHAIEGSKFSVVIFSKNYATSSWCLNELDHIMECAKKKMQTVLPVFYRVKPTTVRKQKRSYADAFLQLEDHFPLNQIQKWRTALTNAANLSGWHSSKRNDAQLVDELVKHIRGKLKTPRSINYLEQRLVGMPKRVEDVKELLKNGSKVGICGMGGLGKTTLAEAVFNECRHQFDLYCFLPNVREEVEKHGVPYLVEKMFKGLLKEGNGVLDDAKKKMLYQKKLLLVLDDVDNFIHYEDLLKDERNWFNSESKVIITGRDKQVLRNICNGNENIYDLQLLDQKEALQLFSLYAFREKGGDDEGYIETSKEFVDYAKGVPLALKVLGSHLFGKKRDAWQSLLSKLKDVGPDQGVQKVLKISFDGLDGQQKSIFLDIACLFRHKYENYVKQVLDTCYRSFHDDIEVLLDKCLITRSKHKYVQYLDEFQVHDLLQEMAHSIVRGSHDNCLESYNSRLWKSEDIYHVLTNDTVNTTVKGVSDVNGGFKKLGPSTFEKLPNLRILILHGNPLYFSHDFDCTLPNQLRHLEWRSCPLESLGPNFKPHKLGGLIMQFSKLKKLWNESQDVENLKYVDLSDSLGLTCLPNLPKANLQWLRLSNCENLVDLPPLNFHDILDDAEKDFEVMRQFILADYEHLLKICWAINLGNCLLDLSRCSNLKNLSNISGNIKFICLSSTAIKKLHFSIGFLNKLLVLDIRDCKCIKKLPSSICNLKSLEYLDMSGCVSIKKFPKLPKSIKGLDLSGTSIQQVDPSSFECLPSLRLLYMNECTKLESLPTTICKLESLVKLRLKKCLRLKNFPEILEPMEKIEKLYLNESGIEEIPSSIENLVMLDELFLESCKNLKCLPTTIFKLKSLVKLDIRWCPQLKIFPEIWQPMEKLHKVYCGSTFYSLITSGARKITVSQLQAEVKQFKCRKSCSITSINVSIGIDDSHGFDGIPFTCCECFLFYSLHNILATQYFLEKKSCNRKDVHYVRACFSYSGNAVPEWCTQQSVGSSIEVMNLVPSLDNNFSFLGCAICLVVHIDRSGLHFFTHDLVHFKYELRFRRNDGRSYQSGSYRYIQVKFTEDYGGDILDYVFTCYLDTFEFDLRAVEVLFKFHIEKSFFPIEIKRCGVRLIYHDDAKEFVREKPLF